jgi:hypothetical protein
VFFKKPVFSGILCLQDVILGFQLTGRYNKNRLF